MNDILILTDGKAGHENQSKAFARALGGGYELAEVHFRSKLHKALSYAFDWLGVHTTSLLRGVPDISRDDGPRAIVGTGSGTFYAAKSLAKRLGAKCGVVLYPRGYCISTFDCVLSPAFDRPAKAGNVIEIPANLVANDESFYENGVKEFMRHYRETTKCDLADHPKAVAVIIGGPNKCSTMTPEWMKRQLDAIFAANGGDVEFWVTTSRRTPTDVEKVVDSYPWTYRLLYSRDHFNPIPAFVKLARRLYVTAESTGMLSEACTFGTAEVRALDNLNPGLHKFRRFVDDLRKCGYVDGNRKVDLSAEFKAAKSLMGL